MKNEKISEQMSGILSAVGAYFLWGILPIYWKMIHHVTAFEILAHRIVWSLVFMMGMLIITRGMGDFIKDCRQLVTNRRQLFGVVMAALLISVNWCTYIWSVNENRIVEASLGYYINPLVNVMLGVLVLKEKLSKLQILSFSMAGIGVLIMTVNFGSIPWVALILAISFALYGLFKKMVNMGSLTGITVETGISAPVALLYLASLHQQGVGAFSFAVTGVPLLLMGAGIVTAIPLILFAKGANRLSLSMLGFIQYVSPTISLFIGVFMYHEPFTLVHLVAFLFIWLGLIIFSLAKTNFFQGLQKRYTNQG